MLRTWVSTCLLMALGASRALAADWAAPMFEGTSHDFGTVARDAKAVHQFVFTNSYLEDVHVASAVASCGCTSVSISQPQEGVKTYQEGVIVAKFNTDRFLGQRGATITVSFDKPFYATVRLDVRGNILGDLVFSPGSVDLGDVGRGTPVVKEVSVQYMGGGHLQILGAKSVNPHLLAQLVPVGQGVGRASYKLQVQLKPDAPVGYLKDNVLLVTNDPHRPQVPVSVEGRVLADITVSPSSLFFGVVQQGQRTAKPIVVRGNRPFRITAATADGEDVEFNLAGANEAKNLHVIPVTFVPGAEQGRIVRTIQIKTDLGNETWDLTSYAVVQPAPRLAARP